MNTVKVGKEAESVRARPWYCENRADELADARRLLFSRLCAEPAPSLASFRTSAFLCLLAAGVLVLNIPSYTGEAGIATDSRPFAEVEHVTDETPCELDPVHPAHDPPGIAMPDYLPEPGMEQPVHELPIERLTNSLCASPGMPPITASGILEVEVDLSGAADGIAAGQASGNAGAYPPEAIREAIRRHMRYPPAARRSGLEGTVELTLTIGRGGAIEQMTTRSPDADDSLVRAVCDAARKAAPFRGAAETRATGPVTVTVPVRFELAGR